MGVILNALLLDIPESLATPRLELRATRAGMGAAVNAAVLESRGMLKPWMPWAQEPQSLAAAEEHCREMQAKWHAREMLDFCFHGILRQARRDNAGELCDACVYARTF